jgi:hypothetical protein
VLAAGPVVEGGPHTRALAIVLDDAKLGGGRVVDGAAHIRVARTVCDHCARRVEPDIDTKLAWGFHADEPE